MRRSASPGWVVCSGQSGTVTRPLRSLRRATERLTGGDLSARAETTIEAQLGMPLMMSTQKVLLRAS